MKPGVLFVVNSIEPGGAEVFILRLAQYFRPHYNCFILPVDPKLTKPSFLNQMVARSGVVLLSQPNYPPKLADFFIYKVQRLLSVFGVPHFRDDLVERLHARSWKRLFRKNNLTVINSHLFAADLFVYREIMPRIPGTPWVITMHSSYNPEAFDKFSPPVRKKFFLDAENVLSSASYVFCVSARNLIIQEYLRSKPHIEKQYLGYTPSLIDKSNIVRVFPKGHFVFIMVGRGLQKKGWELALSSFQQINRSYPESGLICVGEMTEFMISMQNKYGNPNIHFTGYTTEVEQFIAQSDVGLLPSYGESLPYAIIEYLGADLPVIASNRGEIPLMLQHVDQMAGYIISDDENGIPSQAELTSRMKLMIEQPDTYSNLRAIATLAFKKFTMESCGNRYLEVFNQLIDDQG